MAPSPSGQARRPSGGRPRLYRGPGRGAPRAACAPARPGTLYASSHGHRRGPARTAPSRRRCHRRRRPARPAGSARARGSCPRRDHRGRWHLLWALLDRTTGTRYQSDNAERHLVHRVDGEGVARRRRPHPRRRGSWPSRTTTCSSDDPRQRRRRGRDGLLEQRGQREHRTHDPDLPAAPTPRSTTAGGARPDVGPRRGQPGPVHRRRHRRRAGTGWLLDEMRQVRGEGRFGIVDALEPRRRGRRWPSRTAGPCTTTTAMAGQLPGHRRANGCSR